MPSRRRRPTRRRSPTMKRSTLMTGSAWTVAGALGALGLSVMLHAAGPAASVVDAAMQGNKEAVRALLKQGADVNTAQGDGMTALHWAVQKGDVDLAKTL